MTQIKVVGFTGSQLNPSRSSALVEYIVRGIGGEGAQNYSIIDLGSDFVSALSRQAASESHGRIWDAVVDCDVLVVGTPVYKASYTGMFKHFFDVLPIDSLDNRPVVLTASGKSLAHSLVIEHQLTPLFRFFNANPLSRSVFSLDEEFRTNSDEGYDLHRSLSERCDVAIEYAKKYVENSERALA